MFPFLIKGETTASKLHALGDFLLINLCCETEAVSSAPRRQLCPLEAALRLMRTEDPVTRLQSFGGVVNAGPKLAL